MESYWIDKLLRTGALSAVVIAAAAVGCLTARFLFRKKLDWKRVIPYLLLAGYLAALAVTAVFERAGHPYAEPQINLIPFNDLRSHTVRTGRAILMLVLNTLVFIPWGVLLPVLYRPFRRFRWILPAGLGLSLLIELIQLFFKIGIFETDDLIFNTLGTIFGFSLYKFCDILIVRKSLKKGKEP